MRRAPRPLAGETHHSTPVGLAYSAEDVPVLLLRPGSLPGLLEEVMDVGGATLVTSLLGRGLDHDENGLMALKICEATLESAEKGQPVKI